MSTSAHLQTSDDLLPGSGDILVLKEKVAEFESRRASTEADLKDIREIISQVKLLMNLTIGDAGLSIISLIVTIAALASLLR